MSARPFPRAAVAIGVLVLVGGAVAVWRASGARTPETPLALPAPGSLEDAPLEARIADLAAAAEQASDDPLAWARLAMTLHVHEAFAPAVAAYDRALALHEDEARWWWLRACALEHLDRYDDALRSADRARALDPKYAPIPATLARWHAVRGDLDGAVKLAEEAVRLAPDDGGCWLVLASVRLDRGEFAEGEANARRAMGRTMARPAQAGYAHFVLGACLRGLGVTEMARVHTARGRDGDARFPVDDPWRNELADFQYGFRSLLASTHADVQAGAFDVALPFLEELRRRNPDHVQVLGDLGLCYQRTGRIDEAIGTLRDGLARHPSHGGLSARLAEALEQKGDADGARAVLDAAVAAHPQDGEVLEARGMWHFRKGDATAAVTAFEAAFAADPSRPWVLVHAAAALLEAGRTDEADAMLRRAGDADPGNADVPAGFAIVHARRGDLIGAMERLDYATDLAGAPTPLLEAAHEEIQRAARAADPDSR